MTMNENTVYTVAFAGLFGAIGLGIYLGHKNAEKKEQRNFEYETRKAQMRHEESLQESKIFEEMSPEDRKAVMIEKEKTKQANAEIQKAKIEKEKAEAEVKKAEIIKNLIENPLPKPSPVSVGTSNGGSVSINLA